MGDRGALTAAFEAIYLPGMGAGWTTGAPRPRRCVTPPALECLGRLLDRWGVPVGGRAGQPHGRVLQPERGESGAALENRARAGGWRIEALADFDRRRLTDPDAVRSVMCPNCGRRVGAAAAERVAS